MSEHGNETVSHLVALLFVSSEPIELATAARVLERPLREVEQAARELELHPPPGLLLQRHNGAIQLATAPASAPYVRRLLGAPETTRLSRAALEVLALIAFRQPITRSEIDAVRGVASDRALSTLIARGLVEEVGRRETVGHPALLGTTVHLLEYLGIHSLDELPSLDGDPSS
jgi:segregation and condensation protein B